MKRASTFLATLGFTVFGMNVAQAACVQPDVEQLLIASQASIGKESDYFPTPDAKFLPQTIDGRDLQWMGASWQGPPGGALFLLDCAGQPLTHSRFGVIEEVKTGPTVPSGQTAEITYISGYGTGVHVTSVRLVNYINGAIKTVWDHEATSIIANPGSDYKDTFNWKISDKGKRITVHGLREVDAGGDEDHPHWAPGTKHSLPEKPYCWSTEENKFQSCDPKS